MQLGRLCCSPVVVFDFKLAIFIYVVSVENNLVSSFSNLRVNTDIVRKSSWSRPPPYALALRWKNRPFVFMILTIKNLAVQQQAYMEKQTTNIFLCHFLRLYIYLCIICFICRPIDLFRWRRKQNTINMLLESLK